MRMRTLCRRLLIWAATAVVVAACTTVPETGRSQLNFIPQAELQTAATTQFNQMKAQETVSHDPQYNAQVQRVGERIAKVVADEMPDANWEFVVFDDPQVNAFAMPGGKVGVYTGLLKLVDSDDELAVVLGHEIAHVTSHHGGERASQQALAQFGAQGLQALLGEHSQQLQQIASTAYGLGAQYGVLMPFSREQEAEADHIGLLYAARAGYNPQAAITFWKKMQQATASGEPPEFLSDHPSTDNRIQALKAEMPKAMQEYHQAK